MKQAFGVALLLTILAAPAAPALAGPSSTVYRAVLTAPRTLSSAALPVVSTPIQAAVPKRTPAHKPVVLASQPYVRYGYAPDPECLTPINVVLPYDLRPHCIESIQYQSNPL